MFEAHFFFFFFFFFGTIFQRTYWALAANPKLPMTAIVRTVLRKCPKRECSKPQMK